MMEKEQYKRCLHDEVDWKELDQLHSAVAQISNFCFEAKKTCLTVEFVVLGLIATFTQKSLDDSIFFAAMLIPTLFLFLDGTGYYYQRKLRNRMDGFKRNIIDRNSDKSESSSISTDGQFIENSHSNDISKPTALGSVINNSMWVYYIMIIVAATSWASFSLGLIK